MPTNDAHDDFRATSPSTARMIAAAKSKFVVKRGLSNDYDYEMLERNLWN